MKPEKLDKKRKVSHSIKYRKLAWHDILLEPYLLPSDQFLNALTSIVWFVTKIVFAKLQNTYLQPADNCHWCIRLKFKSIGNCIVVTTHSSAMTLPGGINHTLPTLTWHTSKCYPPESALPGGINHTLPTLTWHTSKCNKHKYTFFHLRAVEAFKRKKVGQTDHITICTTRQHQPYSAYLGLV